jgi:hypothetical protein
MTAKAFEWHNPDTGHCYVDYVPHNLMDENNGYVKTPLYKHDEITAIIGHDFDRLLTAEVERRIAETKNKAIGVDAFCDRLDNIFEMGNPTKAQIIDAYNKSVAERMPTEDIEEILERIDKDIEKPMVTAQFGDMWKSHAIDHYMFHDLVIIAWKQGRRAILLEKELRSRMEEKK